MDARPAPAHSNWMKGSVLLVDDNLPYLVAVQASLEPLGVEVVLAESGDDALRLILERDFSIIIMDLKLSDMNGFELHSLIRKRDRCRALPLVIVTGLDELEASAFTGYRAGAFEMMRKPVHPERLRAKVVSACVAGMQEAA